MLGSDHWKSDEGGGTFPTCTIIFSKFFACVDIFFKNHPLLEFFFRIFLFFFSLEWMQFAINLILNRKYLK
jgi:hypothetical protein